jgi:hypothetical protein
MDSASTAIWRTVWKVTMTRKDCTLEKRRPMIEEVLKISEIARLEVHDPESELAKSRVPIANLNPQFFTLAAGFRR